MTNFGASFKQARESRGIPLDEIAIETRISTRFLQAIENEEFHLLPGGIFNRGFIRTYAERVGLDPEKAVADYSRLTEFRELEPSRLGGSAPAKTGRSAYPLAILGLILLILIFYAVTRSSESNPSPATMQSASRVSEPVSAPLPPAPPETVSAASPPAEVETLPAENPLEPENRLEMELEAQEQTWIKVTTDGSTVVPGEILEPGMTRKFTAQNSIGLILGNAGGVKIKINDQPAKPLGGSGQVRELTITPSNLQDLIG